MRQGANIRRAGARGLIAVTVTFILACLLASTLGCSGSGLEQVPLDSGPVVGEVQDVQGAQIWTFRGIPYAAPPVGDLRWRAPRAVESWQEPRRCTEFGPACPQPSMLEMFSLSAGQQDEDCLYLNVWSPASSAGQRLPVMVWIHGGSFETGSGAMGIYDGSRLAAEGVIVVTVNYRLGPFGFLSHPALSAEDGGGVSGNYGLLDQIAALEWVQRNIEGFGGDSQNVTVFGESAGAMSILDLIVSPPAAGLFQRAIVQSGILMDQGFGTKMVAGRQEAEAQGREFASALGVDGMEDAAAALRAKSSDEIMAASRALTADLADMQGILYWKPVVDGVVLPDMPTALWLEGRYPPVSMLIGSNADEADLFLAGMSVNGDRYEDLVGDTFGEYADDVLALYPSERLGPTQALGRALTEMGFASSARFAAACMSAQGPQVYLYEFTRAPLAPLMGAFHAVELPYVFGTLEDFSWTGAVRQADRDLSATVRGYWTRFAATGDPNGTEAPSWPAYDEASDIHLRLGTTVDTSAGLYGRACDLADRIRGAR